MVSVRPRVISINALLVGVVGEARLAELELFCEFLEKSNENFEGVQLSSKPPAAPSEHLDLLKKKI